MNVKECFKAVNLAKCSSTGLLLLRIVAGTAMIIHGWGKIQAPMSWMGPEAPVPGIFQFLAAFSEFGGGIAWILGFLTPLASLGMAITMVVATYTHAVVMGDPFVSTGKGSYELALLYFVISILFIMTGPGKWSIDSKLFGEKNA